MVLSASPSEQRSRLIETYRQLSQVEQLLVQLMSVIYEPISRALLVNCWNHLGTQDRGNVHFSQPSLKPYLERLIQQQVVVQSAQYGPQCHPLIVEVATRHAIRANRFERLVQAVEKGFPIPRRWKDGPVAYGNDRQLIREVRLGIYRNDIQFIKKQIEDYYRYSYQKDKISLERIYLQICNNPVDPDWLCTLSPEIFEGSLNSILNHSLLKLTPADAAFDLLKGQGNDSKLTISLQVLLIEQLLLRGEMATAQALLEQKSDDPEQHPLTALKGQLAFFQGATETAIALYTSALQALRKGSPKRKLYFQSLSGLFFVLALLQVGSPERLSEAVEYVSIARQTKHWLSPIYSMLEYVIRIQQGDLSYQAVILNTPIASYEVGNSLETLFFSLCLYWVDQRPSKKHLPRLLEPFYEAAQNAGYFWLAKTAAELLAAIHPKSVYGDRAAALLPASHLRSLVTLVQPQEDWERCLTALTGMQREAGQPATTTSIQRLAWFVTLYQSTWMLHPREQSLNVKGEWSKGRPIALKRLKSNADEFRYLTPQDLKVCAQIKSYNINEWGSKTEYRFSDKAIALLIGHPHVFWEDAPTTRVEVVKGEPELLVKKGKNDRLTLQFSPELKDKQDIVLLKESPTRLKVIEVTPEHRRIAEILGKKNQLEVPAIAKERVLAAIHAVSSIVTVHSDIGGGVATEEIPSDAKPRIHLLPAHNGLRVSVLTRPFAVDGPYYQPGTGGETVIAEIDGKRLQTTRNLEEEVRLAEAAIANCPTLLQYEPEDNEWLIEETEDCLELLLQLQELGDTVVIEQPEGEKFRVSHQATLQDFRLNIKRQNDWFATDGELHVSRDMVLDMQELMKLLEQTHSRFIPVGDGQFIALTQEFRKRLDELRSYADRSSKGLRLHPLAALAVEDWVDEVGEVKADKHWKAHLKRLKEVQSFEPQLPSTLQADLRDYQIDGFRWLARLAHWGVGACLADDMGLGKTVQALAVILTRAAEGATLVVAPTSVGMNWLSEAQRFAPTLNVLTFGSGDRQKMLDQLKPFDLVVCSYGLLQQEEVAEMLAQVQWQTIILDEAQSIKNFATKRSQAAMNLQGGFKLITTGTPIENHLGELWNLFRFINPGLLGSLESFNQRFAVPIERYNDRQARHRLKKLIQPFLLRRTKNQVLEELPSRTEILLQVELSQEELAFYEAIRREALVRLSESDATAGAKHLQVLAEIMRLRRACCNTRLVKPEIALPSAKLQLFGEILTELLENKHKALVFSQFVAHLHIIRDELDRRAIAYQYLDGSTPAPERKKRVNAFQAGEGDVFLISLKAGGTGLNLTAADYVIHMDPWWNPAVEDQASDRAHRIGQQRPVTIYRLVAKNTIEEKIVELHQHKRDLADSLLEDTEMSGKMSTEELLRLISES